MSSSLNKLLQVKRSRLFWTSYVLLALAVAVVGALGGLVFGYALDLPEVEELQAKRPNIVSYVYSDDGRILGQFALERRILVNYDQIPEPLKNAVLAAEDAGFFRHSGIDFQRLFVTIVRDIVLGERKGASTLTMQLSKLRFTSTEKTIERKIKDMLFALEIEKNYSKEQIFTFYCNQINLGHGRYGIASAADFYFNKPIGELTVAEAALLAGMIQAPARYSPVNHPKRALQRRNAILMRMYEENFLDASVLQEALNEPIEVRAARNQQSPAPYFVEWVRQYLERNYSTEQIWEGGLRIHTTLDYDMQVAARRALTKGLSEFDKKVRGWTGPEENILDQGKDLESYYHPEWRRIFYEGQIVRGLVLESNPEQARVKLGSYTTTIEPQDIEWVGTKRVDRVLKAGDVAVFRIQTLNRAERVIDAVLDQIPEVQGALLALENKTGAIKVMVGGFDFEYSKFNRATQALRQPGSLFKPFTYVGAMEEGYLPSDLLLDAPVSFRDALGRVYAPENSDLEFQGLIPIRKAFALSRNVPTIRLASALGIEKVIQVAHRFGIDRHIPPYLPIALGASELTLQEITSAFSVFPNNGVRARPFFVKQVDDYHGVTLETHQNRFEQVVSPETAAKMTYLLRQVVLSGTAWRARSLERPVAGKTGTTDDSTDSWFVGFTPQITAGVWAGYDEKKSLGEKVYGATLALPIWTEFMQGACENLPANDFENIYVPRDLNLAQKTITGESGDAESNEASEGSDSVDTWKVEDIPPPSQQ